MKISTLHSTFRALAIVLGITIATQASARHFRSSDANAGFLTVAVLSTPTTSAFGDITPSTTFGTLRIPASPLASMNLRDGGDHDGHRGGGGHDNDTTGGDDTTGGPGNGDTTHHCGGGLGDGGDSTHHGFGGPDGDNDSSGFGLGDTSGHHCGGHGGDSTGFGDNGDDTVDCGHHGHDDTTAVTDTSLHSLFNGGAKQSIVIKAHGQQSTVNFTFTNNLATSVTISNISLSSGKNFSIVSGAPTMNRPAKLAAGASINLKIAFKSVDQNVHTDQLVVASNSSVAATTISLTGQQLASASVASLPVGVSIATAPNPMTSSLKVSLTGVTNASVAIYDMQGKILVNSSLTSSEWVWNGTSADGTSLIAGTYFVRLSGVSTDNTPFASTQKIILVR